MLDFPIGLGLDYNLFLKRTVPRKDMQVRGVSRTKKTFVVCIPLTLTEELCCFGFRAAKSILRKMGSMYKSSPATKKNSLIFFTPYEFERVPMKKDETRLRVFSGTANPKLSEVRIQLGQGSAQSVTKTMLKNEGTSAFYNVNDDAMAILLQRIRNKMGSGYDASVAQHQRRTNSSCSESPENDEYSNRGDDDVVPRDGSFSFVERNERNATFCEPQIYEQHSRTRSHTVGKHIRSSLHNRAYDRRWLLQKVRSGVWKRSEFENAVLREPSRVPVPGGTVHPLTRQKTKKKPNQI